MWKNQRLARSETEGTPENSIQGGFLGAFYKYKLKSKAGEQFLVLPLPIGRIGPVLGIGAFGLLPQDDGTMA